MSFEGRVRRRSFIVGGVGEGRPLSMVLKQAAPNPNTHTVCSGCVYSLVNLLFLSSNTITDKHGE